MADLSAYYGEYGGNVPPPPTYTPRGGSSGPSPLSYADPVGNVGDFIGLPSPAGFLGGLFGGGDKPKRPPQGGREYWKGRALLNAYNWLLPYSASTTERGADVYGDIWRRQAAKSKAYELAQFEDYAPRYAQAILNADPRQAQLLQSYNDSIYDTQGYVDRLRGRLDNPMDNASIRDITQASLGNSAMKGFGPQARDAALAYIQTGLVGQQMQNQREGIYQQALSMLDNQYRGGVMANKSVLGDPFLAFAGRPGQPQGSNPMSPNYSDFNNDLFSYSVNGDIQRKNMAAANSASNKALIGQLVGSLLGSAGGVAKGMI